MNLKTDVLKWRRTIDKHMAKIAKERDALDEAISELEELKSCCVNAYDSLQTARDELSTLV